MRVCSFFSSATELLAALGCGSWVVGRSEHCDYPPEIRKTPVIVRSRIPSDRLSSRGIDQAVKTLSRTGQDHYWIDVPLLTKLKPELVVTQDLCNVCAASHPEVQEAIQHLQRVPESVSVNARTFEEILDSIGLLGKATGRQLKAKQLTQKIRTQVAQMRETLREIRVKPKVWCAEWLDPLMSAGHWVPEMVNLAGGTDLFGKPGQASRTITWEQVERENPEVILVMPCSFSMARAFREVSLLTRHPGWKRLKAVQTNRVFVVKTTFFHHPGPRLLEGLKIMAALFHPDRFQKPASSWVRPFRERVNR